MEIMEKMEITETMEHVRSAVKIFRLLITQGEINKREQAFLYSEYLETEVQEVLSVFEEEFECKLLNFDDTVYLVPNINSQIIGVQPGELKRYFGSNATNKDVYLGYYIMMFIFYEFYSGKNKDPKKTDFVQVSHLIDHLDERFERLQRLSKDEIEHLEEEYSVNLASCIEIWMNLLVDHESRKKTKTKIIEGVVKILEENKLAYMVENQIRTTKKLDVLMRQYYLNAERVGLISEAFEKGDL
ncbi:MAG TPA: DUF6063 family protein [Clostridiales bacterium]|nr:DUF6063 family protein [Clostridiales bacterium]